MLLLIVALCANTSAPPPPVSAEEGVRDFKIIVAVCADPGGATIWSRDYIISKPRLLKLEPKKAAKEGQPKGGGADV